MHERHTNREKYFNEQGVVTANYVIPFIEPVKPIHKDLVVGEIGCGEAGNLKPFVDMGCRVIGIDLAANKIENGKKYYENHPNKNRLTLIAEDIYKIDPNTIEKFDLIIMRDTLEHIPDQDRFLGYVKSFLKPDGKLFLGFPPWRMPFGGHQQMAVNKYLSLLPYFHLLPQPLYKGVLKAFKEPQNKIDGLMEVRDTRISIQHFLSLVKKHHYKIDKQVLYMINPNYELKFKMKPRKVDKVLDIPYLRDFYVTTCYFIISPNEAA
jgi:SAM-dependent methyltransferase